MDNKSFHNTDSKYNDDFEVILKSIISTGYSSNEKIIKNYLNSINFPYKNAVLLLDLVDNYKQAKIIFNALEKNNHNIERNLIVRLFWKPFETPKQATEAKNLYRRYFSADVFEERLNNPVMIYYENLIKQNRLNELKLNFYPLKVEEIHLTKPVFKIERTIQSHKRSALTKKAALEKAQYTCEINANHNTFISKSTKKQYVEAHHLIPLNFQHHFSVNLDIKENIVALCPNCHRKLHHAQLNEIENLLEKLFNVRIETLRTFGIKITVKELIMIYANGVDDDEGVHENEPFYDNQINISP